MTVQENPIRKIAVLVSVLDTDAADALLDGLPADTAAQVREQVMELSEIDPSEQQIVIEQFLTGARGRDTSLIDAAGDHGSPVANPMALSAYLSAKSRAASASDGSSTVSPPRIPFCSLEFVDSERLSNALRHEHPQAVAVVLAHLGPQQAADVITLLPPRQQAEVVRRIVELEHVDAELLNELDHGVADLIGPASNQTPMRTGLAAMREILAAAVGQGRGVILKNLRNRDAALAGALSDAPAQATSDASSLSATAAASSQTNFPPAVALHVEFDDFIDFDEASLRGVLQRAGGRLLLLALAGASEALVERIYQQLPPREAGLLRRQIEQQGPISLRDVAEAQRRLARLAAELELQGLIELPPQQRFAAAA